MACMLRRRLWTAAIMSEHDGASFGTNESPEVCIEGAHSHVVAFTGGDFEPTESLRIR